ncbi:MAG: Rab geranylgeranyltransferase [Geoglossum umbratile]|nr:MAG: Rab geranylgeranyltransferase [Geoglossum umbratile]
MSSHGVPRPSGARPPRTEQARAKELAKIEEYRALVSLVQVKMAEKEYTSDVLSLTTKLLTQNPEYYTIWNHRRRILQHQMRPPPDTDHTDPDHQSKTHALLTADLAFLLPLLLTHPKAYTLWTHRLWLLRQTHQLLPAPLAAPLWHAELALCTKLLARDPRNFHGWGYRRYVAGELMAGDTAGGGGDVVEGEFAYASRMVEANLSNFSAWHARAAWGVRVLDVRGAGEEERLRFFEDELALITRALYTDPYDQSLWFYHTYLLLTTCSPKLPPPGPARAAITPLAPAQKAHYLRREIATLHDLLTEGVDDCKWVLEALVVYTGWLGRCEGAPEEEMEEGGGIGDWLRRLEALDPLRLGRWRDWAADVGVLE